MQEMSTMASTFNRGKLEQVRMAHLAIVGSFKVNGVEVSKDEFEQFLVPSARSENKTPTEVFNIKEANLVSFNGEVAV
jgi:glucan phosphorylase